MAEDLSPELLKAALENLADQGVELIADDGLTEASSVDETDDFLKAIIAGRMKSRGQWAVAAGNYTMVGDTVPELPPGYYDLASSQGQLYFVPVLGRTDKLIRFPHAEVDTVIAEIEKFWKREELFKKFGLPFKRGVLMYGPPGSGKTCALQLIARDVVARGGIVLVYDPGLFLLAYRQVRRVQPNTPVVVLMEDLDAILEHTNESHTLNILDGAERLNRVIFVATTNYPEKLGQRIINRPSRFDKRIRVGHPDETGRRMYLEFLTEQSPESLTSDEITRYTTDTKGMSLAHLKELFVAVQLIGTPYADALKHLTEMHLETPTSLDDDKEFQRDIGGYA